MVDFTSMVKRALRAAAIGGDVPIRGLPQKPLIVGGAPYIPAPNPAVREVAEQYMRDAGMPYVPVQNYVPIDVPRAQRIASEFESMQHAPTDPAVMRSYDALARETRAQYEQLKKLGIKFEPIPAGAPDPYAETPRLAVKDLTENKHMWYFPSEQGFGTGVSVKDQPMLAPSGVKIGGQEVPFNDLFRIVHDVFGHAKEGVGFRAAGEENAWRSHSRMYSPEALPAATTELRGQNSWLNYGPYGEQNRAASAADTIYAPQKAGILPDWVMQAGRMSPLGVAGAAAVPFQFQREQQ